MKHRVWVVGPIAWDSVYYLNEFPKLGKFAQCFRNIERPGGTAANSAIAIASTGIETGFVGYVGDDELSAKLINQLETSAITHLQIKYLTGKPSHVAIYIDNKGERTIIGLSEDRLEKVTLEGVELHSEDIVVFQLWRNHFKKDLEIAKQAGCTTIVGIEALDSDISADIAIGSQQDLVDGVDIKAYLTRFSRIVVTAGSHGASEYSNLGREFYPAKQVKSIDATGAGDAFLAGYVTAVASQIFEPKVRLHYGTTWAALAVQSEASIPPHWNEVIPLLNQ